MKLIDLMRQAGVQWPEGAEYAAQDGEGRPLVSFYHKKPERCVVGLHVWARDWHVPGASFVLEERADDWGVPTVRPEDLRANHTSPDYMREQQRIAARRQERHDLVRELMLRHPELTGQQAIEQADEIIDTLEGLK